METTRLSTKGQIILPKSIRDLKAWKPGTEFVVEAAGDGVLIRPAGLFPPAELKDVVGSLKPRKRQTLTQEQVESAIALEVASRNERGRY